MWRLALLGLVALTLLAPAPGQGGAPPAPQLAFERGPDVWTIRADGTGARRLLSRATAPAWSPDGKLIAFVSDRSGDEELYVARADGTGIRRVTRSPGHDLSPAWSTDGKRLAYSHDAEIRTIKPDGSGMRVVVRKAAAWHEHLSPTWHGTTIVYSSTRVSTFNPELYATPARRLTYTKGSDGVLGDDTMPDFSPDGRLIAFTSNVTRQGEIWTIDANGKNRRRLTDRPGDDWAPAFSPDGARIAFHNLEDGGVWMMGADGTGLRRLTSGREPDWRPR